MTSLSLPANINKGEEALFEIAWTIKVLVDKISRLEEEEIAERKVDREQRPAKRPSDLEYVRQTEERAAKRVKVSDYQDQSDDENAWRASPETMVLDSPISGNSSEYLMATCRRWHTVYQMSKGREIRAVYPTSMDLTAPIGLCICGASLEAKLAAQRKTNHRLTACIRQVRISSRILDG
ncbi:hypothetical protein GCG54_00013844 [Colletotrichum gloeosporioides]|uniref:Uncharacterized protein n=1 Tax=Colletotrichum gloeosporioides TaxID=474922 RepID=A0A8H4FQE8_COLGL|nr:uncharacterized protein GCG54_00013844 [Colletotrichum gloeosporioides]KAF3810602.1 hypothetical protein GCG54_00013844 [Colletotrichum gloeosporioides]